MATRCMPWWKFSTGTRHHSKVMRFRALLGNKLADAYVYRLWDYCAERQADGCFRGAGAAFEVALAVDFDGPPDSLLSALVASGLLDAVEDGFEVHDWEEMQGALVEKFRRDAVRPAGRTRAVSIPSEADSEPVPLPSRACPSVVPRGTSAGPSPYLSVSTSSASTEGGVGETATVERPPLTLVGEQVKPPRAPRKRKEKPPPDPRHAAIVKALCEAPPGYAFLGAQDAMAVGRLLALADSNPATAGEAAEAEVLRRWRICRAWRGFPQARHLGDFAASWNAYAQPQPEPQGPPPNARAPVRAETQPQYDPSKPASTVLTGREAFGK
jgi:hypothetical protein